MTTPASQLPPHLAQNEAVGLHLSAFPWQWYVTLTFRASSLSELSADHALWDFLRAVRKAQGFAPGFFAVTEYQRRGVPHFHLLMLNVGDLRRLDAKDYWERYGHARVEAYDPLRGANYYVGKYLFKTAGSVKVSRNLRTWLPGPDSPTVKALGQVFDVGQGEQPTTGTRVKQSARHPSPATSVGSEAKVTPHPSFESEAGAVAISGAPGK